MKLFWNQTKPLFSGLDVTFTRCCSVVFCLLPVALLANCHFAPKMVPKTPTKTKESSLLLGGVQHAHMLQWAREEVQNGWMS